MLKRLRFKSSVLFGIHNLLDKSIKTDSSEILDCIH